MYECTHLQVCVGTCVCDRCVGEGVPGRARPAWGRRRVTRAAESELRVTTAVTPVIMRGVMRGVMRGQGTSWEQKEKGAHGTWQGGGVCGYSPENQLSVH